MASKGLSSVAQPLTQIVGILGNGHYDRAHIEESTVRLGKQGGERKKEG